MFKHDSPGGRDTSPNYGSLYQVAMQIFCEIGAYFAYYYRSYVEGKKGNQRIIFRLAHATYLHKMGQLELQLAPSPTLPLCAVILLASSELFPM